MGILSMNKSVILCTMKYVTVLSQLMVEMEEVPVDLEEVPVDLEALPVVTLVVHNLDMELLLPLLAVKSQDRSATMFPDRSAEMSQDKNAVTYHLKSATMFPSKSQDNNAPMLQ